MSNVHDNTVKAEHPGFLLNMKDELHIGHHEKAEEVALATILESTDIVAASKSTPTVTDAPTTSPRSREGPL